MEYREGNVIVNIDKILTPDRNEFIRKTTEMLGKLVELQDDMFWIIAADGIVKTGLALRMAKDIVGDKNE